MNHLHHKTTKIAISDHIEICHNCMLNIIELNSFKVLRICDSEHATKAQEALLKKKKKIHKPIDSFTLMIHRFS